MKRLPVALAVAAVLLGAGCGTEAGGPDPAPEATGRPSASGPAATAAYNATDVMFLQMMLAHHQPAADLLRLARARATEAEVKTLAAALEVTQADDMETMRALLTDWGEPLISDAPADAHAAHGGLPATGPKEIRALAGTPRKDFDRAFLTMLIGHQHNAVELARMELKSGANPEAKALAERLDRAVRAQIQHMLSLSA